MPFIDMMDYRIACGKARELVDRITLREAIYRVYKLWFNDKDEGKKIVFHSYFGLSLFDLGIDDMFEHEQYRKALAAYFQPRALRKLAELRAVRTMPRNPVEIARPDFVRIRVTDEVSLEFHSINKRGPLKWRHIVEGDKVTHFGNGDLGNQDEEDSIRHSARVQALAVMEDKRASKKAA